MAWNTLECSCGVEFATQAQVTAHAATHSTPEANANLYKAIIDMLHAQNPGQGPVASATVVRAQPEPTGVPVVAVEQEPNLPFGDTLLGKAVTE